MTHDIQDLLDLIKELEKRVIILELNSINSARHVQREDGWYWDH